MGKTVPLSLHPPTHSLTCAVTPREGQLRTPLQNLPWEPPGRSFSEGESRRSRRVGKLQSEPHSPPACFRESPKTIKKKKSRTAVVLLGIFFFYLYFYKSGLLFNLISKAHGASFYRPPALARRPVPSLWPGSPLAFIVSRMAECKPVPCSEQAGTQDHEAPLPRKHPQTSGAQALIQIPALPLAGRVDLGRPCHVSVSITVRWVQASIPSCL